MAERSDRLERGTRAVRTRVALDWDDARIDALLVRTKARARRRTVFRAGLSAAAVVALAAGAFALASSAEQAAPELAETPPEPVDGVIRLADGSRVTPLTDDAEIVVMEVSEAEIRVALERGAARFEVVSGLPRAFRVSAGQVEVSVVGTVFDVRREGEGAHVRVLEGRVRVAWPPDEESFLDAGGADSFPHPPEQVPPQLVRAPEPVAEPVTEPVAEPVTEPVAELTELRPTIEAPVARRRPRPPAPEEPAWVAHAERGEYDEAARILERDPSALEDADVDALLLASDTMRLMGRPERALAFLEQASAAAEGDARAPLVAFTRGRLLLTGLARAREAAAAFAHARALAPDGSLASDALAREVEALAEAGDDDAAHARAEQYLALYPNGLRVEQVRRWGHLE